MSLQFEVSGFDEAVARLSALGRPELFRTLREGIGAELVDFAAERISETKAAPDGRAWPPWSAAYARTRRSGQSLLRGEGDLLLSLSHFLQGDDTVVAGSPLVYARTHQEGDPSRNIPARRFIGISEAEGEALERLVAEFVLDAFAAGAVA